MSNTKTTKDANKAKGQETEIPKEQQTGTTIRKSSKSPRIVGIIAFLVGFFAVSFFLSHGYSSSTVHVTNIEYYYYDPYTGSNWTYSFPGSYDMQPGSMVNGAYPFTSNLTCAMSFTNAYAMTPGFQYRVYNLPVTFQPGLRTDLNISITAPNYSHSGPLDVKIYVNYSC
jgi:hypothetical protein